VTEISGRERPRQTEGHREESAERQTEHKKKLTQCTMWIKSGEKATQTQWVESRRQAEQRQGKGEEREERETTFSLAQRNDQNH